MSETVIKVEQLSKRYRLGLVGAGTLREDLVGLWYKLTGKEDPYLQLAESNIQSQTSDSDYVWALKDVNFEVRQGEVLGIIGKNGAGKSTLLKLLSRVTAPTQGTIKAKGRIASLLEVGTGFHPELTGKENIFLNGAIMGMNRKEIARKLDEIIEFAGIQRYVNTPVKRYSSGMYVRLAFAVAAHLEPEILIVDEVLAVGDAEFQRKALGKMQDVSSGEGRTVLFVSHNMKAVKSLCTRAILMEHGTVAFEGSPSEAVARYLHQNTSVHDNFEYNESDNPENAHELAVLEHACINNSLPIKYEDDVNLEFTIRFNQEMPFHLNFHLKSLENDHIFQTSTEPFQVTGGSKWKVSFTIPGKLLNERSYQASISFVRDGSATFNVNHRLLTFTISERIVESLNWYGTTPGLLNPEIANEVTRL